MVYLKIPITATWKSKPKVNLFSFLSTKSKCKSCTDILLQSPVMLIYDTLSSLTPCYFLQLVTVSDLELFKVSCVL